MTDLKQKSISVFLLWEEKMHINIRKTFLTTKNKLKLLISIAVILIVIAITFLMLSRWKTITVLVYGKQITFATNEDTVSTALREKNINISPNDIVEPSLDSKLEDKENITIRHAVNVKISVDAKQLNILSPEENAESLLRAEGITLNSQDKLNIEKDTKLFEGMEIVITRVETKTITESMPLSFKEMVKEDSSLPNTKREVIQEGKNGEKQVTTEVVYEDGKEVSREVVSEKVTVSAIDRIIVKGTYPLMPVSSSGDALAYSRVFKAKATAYWAVRGVGKTYTASGRKAIWDPNGYSTIAVDPSIIPYGTKLFVERYGFAIAADTGTAIIGDTIDVFFNTYNEACKWGVKYVNVYILK